MRAKRRKAVKRPADERERREVLERINRLPEKDRLWLLEQIREDLSAAGRPGDPVSREAETAVKSRAQALQDLERAAEHLREKGQLEPGEAPTARQYGEVAKELGLGSSASITRTFGLWRNAKAALLGEMVGATPAQRRARRRGSRRNLPHEDPLEGLRVWLSTKPAGRERAGYDAFVEEFNTRKGKDEKRLTKAGSVTAMTALPWKQLVEAAESGQPLAAARQRQAEEQVADLDEPDLIGLGLVALLVGRTGQEVSYEIQAGRFPKPVTRIQRANAWRLGVIRRYIESGEIRETAQEVEGEYLDTAEVAKEVGISPGTLRAYIHRKNWGRIPEPDGRVGNGHYWRRETLERWREARSSGN